MVVKVKNDRDSWSYFECQVIHSRYCPFGKVEKQGGYVVLLENKDMKSDTVVKLLNLETIKGHLREILTDRVCYVLNSEGKTIDKI